MAVVAVVTPGCATIHCLVVALPTRGGGGVQRETTPQRNAARHLPRSPPRPMPRAMLTRNTGAEGPGRAHVMQGGWSGGGNRQ